MHFIGTADCAGHTVRFALDEHPDGSVSGFIELDTNDDTLDRWRDADRAPDVETREFWLPQGTFHFRVCSTDWRPGATRLRARVEGHLINET